MSGFEVSLIGRFSGVPRGRGGPDCQEKPSIQSGLRLRLPAGCGVFAGAGLGFCNSRIG
jgi:hypothetical protein